MPTFQFCLVPPQRQGSPEENRMQILQMQCDSNTDALLLAKKIRSTFPGLVYYRLRVPEPPFIPVDLDINTPPEDPMPFAAYLAQFKVSPALVAASQPITLQESPA